MEKPGLEPPPPRSPTKAPLKRPRHPAMALPRVSQRGEGLCWEAEGLCGAQCGAQCRAEPLCVPWAGWGSPYGAGTFVLRDSRSEPGSGPQQPLLPCVWGAGTRT